MLRKLLLVNVSPFQQLLGGGFEESKIVAAQGLKSTLHVTSQDLRGNV